MKGLSLFSNVGIAELLLKDLDIEIVIANEILTKRSKFYKEVYPNCQMIEGDIYINKDEIITAAIEEDVDFIIATPPCQGMSTVGRMKKFDKRNQLIIPTFDIIMDVMPQYILVENVANFPNTLILDKDNEETTIDKYINDIASKNYRISRKIINTADYGIPQFRKRSIYLLSRHDVNEWLFPLETEQITTVRETIGHLPSLDPFIYDLDNFDLEYPNFDLQQKQSREIHKYHYSPIHCERHVTVMSKTPTGNSAYKNESRYIPRKVNGDAVKGFGSCYKRIDWDKPSPTITMANGVISSQNNVHPGRLQNNGNYSDPRVLTIYEVMLIHTIPDDWMIPSWASDRFIRNVIGESIPPLLVKQLFSTIV